MSHSIEEYYKVYSEKDQRARKDRTCAACDETIRAGDVYTGVFIVDDGGEVEHLSRCARCQKIHLHLRDIGDGDSWPDERLDCGETYEDHWGGEPPAEIAALAFALPGEVKP